ncbi:hypothetical protein J2S13_001662 [Oikeobacillus pervagus]|uniref:DUF2304 domain-containing protein n=1 Tax=Oikeobacillus pervagus TaxID=1325931 RepID=A0AAJ1T152_9BACI|nr:DUF2304 domain-containing protein [Oikeobacillus pervagus]MDQ0215262.1 hypothetical protein [Oikeobacillus pervagus]
MKITWLSFAIVAILFIIVVESVRRGVLETKYSLLWIVTCIIMAFLSISDNLLNTVAGWLNVYYPPSLLFLFGLLFALLIIFDLTRRVSKLNKEMTQLTQDYTILKEELEKRKRQEL